MTLDWKKKRQFKLCPKASQGTSHFAQISKTGTVTHCKLNMWDHCQKSRTDVSVQNRQTTCYKHLVGLDRHSNAAYYCPWLWELHLFLWMHWHIPFLPYSVVTLFQLAANGWSLLIKVPKKEIPYGKAGLSKWWIIES